jgi:probable F420-dependent oxidoreductase
MEIAVTTAFSHHTPVSYMADAAKRIEEAGFAAVWVPEHVLFFPDYASAYPYSDDGKIPGDPDGVLDPFTAMTFIAANTTTLRLGTGVCLVPQRQPVYTAKMVADVDYLSGGRVDFGIGVGWLSEEFVALGQDFSARGARCDEYLLAMKALWGEDPVNFHGETVTINNALFNPKPVQGPHPPIYVGGHSKAALRRTATLGDGWYGYDLSPEDVAKHLATIAKLRDEAGRGDTPVKVTVAPGRVRLDADVAAAYEAAGVEQLVVPLFGRNLDGLNRQIDRVATKIGQYL